MTICKPWVYRSVNAFVFPSGRPWLGRMAVGCDLGLLTPWDRVFEFRLGSDVPYCLFRVACDMRVNRDDLTLHPAAPITHYVTERKLTFFFLFFFFPLPLLLNIKVSSCCFIPAFQSVSLPPSLPPSSHPPDTHCTLPPPVLYTHALIFQFTTYYSGYFIKLVYDVCRLLSCAVASDE